MTMPKNCSKQFWQAIKQKVAQGGMADHAGIEPAHTFFTRRALPAELMTHLKPNKVA